MGGENSEITLSVVILCDFNQNWSFEKLGANPPQKFSTNPSDRTRGVSRGPAGWRTDGRTLRC